MCDYLFHICTQKSVNIFTDPKKKRALEIQQITYETIEMILAVYTEI